LTKQTIKNFNIQKDQYHNVMNEPVYYYVILLPWRICWH